MDSLSDCFALEYQKLCRTLQAMWMSRIKSLDILCIFLSVLIIKLRGSKSENGDMDEYHLMEEAALNDPEYGVKWIYIPDGEGIPRRAELTGKRDFKARAISLSTIKFNLYTRKNYNNSVTFNYINREALNLKETLGDVLDPKEDIKFIIHGWKSGGNITNILHIKDLYLKHHNYNIFTVDWAELANMAYYNSAKNTKNVGRVVYDIIQHLIDNFDMDFNQFHVIGHSLGAHVSGYAGFHTKGRLGRITGLDPAKPCFENWATSDNRLDVSDAQYVDVIHTCSGVLGYSSAMGHADFYPNGGNPPQPGCLGGVLTACSHSRAFELFATSVDTARGFPARQCEDDYAFKTRNCTGDLSYMGEGAWRNVHGIFYLLTGGEGNFLPEFNIKNETHAHMKKVIDVGKTKLRELTPQKSISLKDRLMGFVNIFKKKDDKHSGKV